MRKKIEALLHRRPVVKTILVSIAGGALGAVIPLVQSGVTDLGALAAAAKAGAIAAAAALWLKRPKDATAEDKAGIAVGDVVKFSALPPEAGVVLMTVVEITDSEPGGPHVKLNWFEGTTPREGWSPVSQLTEVK